jgi:hypothetical protein
MDDGDVLSQELTRAVPVIIRNPPGIGIFLAR